MTSLHLLTWIAASILLQLAIYLGIGFWQHWTGYLALRHKVDGLEVTPSPLEVAAATDTLPTAWTGLRTFRVARKTMEDAAQTICSFELVPQDRHALPRFLPGQYLTFSLDIPAQAGSAQPMVRCYSISNAPDPSHYRVSIKRAPAPANTLFPTGRSSNFFHDHVTEGSLLQLRAPAGHFYLDRGEAPVVLIGGGVGITPMLSMLTWCLAQQAGREVWLFYGVRHSQELVLQAQLEALAAAHPNFHLHCCLSDATPDALVGQKYLRQGRVDVALLRALLPLKPYHYYICGPTPLLQSLVPALEDWGVPDSRIHFEAFGPASIQRKKASTSAGAPGAAGVAADIMVTFAKSGKQVIWQADGGTLLDFAEANGMRVDSGCRAGGCGSCQTTITAGEVTYRQTPDFDPEPGTCLLCVCIPKTSVTLEA
jgi:ferredoxin-NADP reductase